MAFWKRGTLALSLLVSCSTSMAMDAFTGHLARYNYDGLSIGLGFGMNYLSLSPSTTEASSSSTAFTKQSQPLIMGALDVGYSLVTASRWFVGGDANIALTDSPSAMATTVTSTATSTATALSIKDSGNFTFALDGLAGYMIADDVLLYTRLGIGRGKKNITPSTTSDGQTVTSPTKESQTLFRVGLGIKYAFAQNFNLNLAYIHSSTQSITKTFSINNAVDSAYNFTLKQNPQWNAVMLSLEIQCSSVSC